MTPFKNMILNHLDAETIARLELHPRVVKNHLDNYLEVKQS